MPHDAQCPALLQEFGDVLRVVGVRPGQYRQAEHRGLEQVVPADRHQAATDEGDIRGGVERLQLAKRVEQEDRLPGRWDLAPAALREADATLPEQRAHGLEPLRMPRHEHEQRVGMPRDDRFVRRKRRILFPFVRAARDPHGARDAALASERAPGVHRCLRYLEVELHVARDAHPLRRGADGAKPLRIGRTLCADQDAV